MNTVPIFLARALAYLARFCVAWENFGFISAIQVFVYTRGRAAPQGIPLQVRKLRRRIVFRGRTDTGVLSHFYYPQFRIRDSPANPVRTIVDAGANIGDETLRFRYFHPTARIIAIEPDAGNFAILSRNFAGDPETFPLNKGLWSRECKLRVIPGDSAQAFHVEEVHDKKEPFDVDAVSIPSLMNQFSLQEIDILKMDIEGAEYEVFSAPNVAEWIGNVKVLIFECPDADRAGATQRIFQAIAAHDFDCRLSGECIVLIRRDTGWTHESNSYF